MGPQRPARRGPNTRCHHTASPTRPPQPIPAARLELLPSHLSTWPLPQAIDSFTPSPHNVSNHNTTYLDTGIHLVHACSSLPPDVSHHGQIALGSASSTSAWTPTTSQSPFQSQPYEEPQEISKHNKHHSASKSTRQNARQAYATQQRRHRCLECKLDPGRRACIDLPICNICKSRRPLHVLESAWTEGVFLDWQSWLEDLNKALRAPSSIQIDANSAQHGYHNHFEPIRLEFSFADRTQEARSVSHTVLFHPSEQDSLCKMQTGSELVFRRPPALMLGQLNQVVEAGVWGPRLWNPERVNLQPNDRIFWSTIQLFTGYFSLMHHLAMTSIESSDCLTVAMQRRVAAEVVYAFGWQLQMLYYEICQQCRDLLESERPPLFPAVVIYGLEVLCCLIRKMQQTDWALDDVDPSHPLATLQKEFNQRVQHICDRLILIECHLSSKYKKCRQLQPVPKFVEFTRGFMVNKDFPSRCVVTMFDAMSDNVSSHPRSKLKRRLVDILTYPNNTVREYIELPLDYHITEDNTLIRSCTAIQTPSHQVCSSGDDSYSLEYLEDMCSS